MKRVAIVGVVALFISTTNATVIDNFGDYDPVGAGIYDTGTGWRIDGPAAGVTISETGINSTLGGNRTTTYTTTGSFGTSLVLAPGYLAAINNSSTYGTAVYSYSNFSIDLTTGTKLILDFDPDHLTYSSPDAVISMTISDGTVSSTVTYDTWGAAYQPGGALYNPPRFDLEFAVGGFSGPVDKTAITSISLSIQTDPAGDYAIYGISTDAIPEPGAITLIVASASGCIFVRRRFLL